MTATNKMDKMVFAENLLLKMAETIDEMIKETFPGEQLGFFFQMFEMGTASRVRYVSNADRAPMIKALRALANAMEIENEEEMETIGNA